MRILCRREVASLVGSCRRLSRNRPTPPAPPRDGISLPESPGLPSEEEGPASEEDRRTRRSPSDCSVMLFPGQGSQFVGMGRGMLQYGNVREMFSAAKTILGYDLLSLCLNGPEEELRKTVHCQPAVFVTSLAAVERLNHFNPQAIENCVAAAGFSVGEYAALVFSGAMDFAEALYAVKVRAEAMHAASREVPGGMLSVTGRPQARYAQACLLARDHCLALGLPGAVCCVASYLFPDGRVLAGHLQALEYVQQNAKQLHLARTALLPVAGAFHTEMMEPACEPLRETLRQLEVRRPEITVHSNVDGQRYVHAGHVRRQLVRQLVAPVRWEQTLHELYQRGRGLAFPHTYELGPGRHLGATLRRCNMKAYKSYTHVDVVAPDNEDED